MRPRDEPSLQRRRWALPLILLPVIVAACGGSDLSRQGTPYTVGEVATRFKELAGDKLHAGHKLDLRRIGGLQSVQLTTAAALRKKYGEFIYVVVWGRPRSEGGQVLDPIKVAAATSGKPTKPQSDRIYWS